MGRLFASLALVWALATPALAVTPAQYIELLSNPRTAAVGQVSSISISDTQWTSITDLTPLSQYTNGWTADVTLLATQPAGATSAYSIIGPSACTLSFTDTSPGYTSSATATTVTRTICGTSWLRQTSPNPSLPTEGANGGNAKLGLTLSDFVFAGDVVSPATALSAMYTSHGVISKATNNIPVTNSSTRTYPLPICAWVTEPGLRVGTSGALTVEMFCGHAYAQGAVPVAAVVFTLSDGTHTSSHTVSALTASARQWSTSCTATNGSNVLTACGTTAGLWVGERLNVAGIKGQPEIKSIDSSTQLTLGQTIAASVTPTTGGAVSIAATPGDGEGLADGAFAGAKITSPNLGDGVTAYTVKAPVGSCTTSGASTTITLGAPGSGNGQWLVGQWITGPNIPISDYLTAVGSNADGSGAATLHAASTANPAGNCTGSVVGANPGGSSVTTAKVSSSATSGTASSTSAVIQHTYQGTTGTVAVTLGNPVPVYSVNFTSSDFSTMSKGLVRVRAQAYPVVGNVVLDTQTGADGSGCDWFYPNVNGGVCNSSSAAWFNLNGTTVSPNLHNLWAYYDSDNSYAPIYVPIATTGTCANVSCVQTSATMPAGSTANYFSSVFTALTYVKSYNDNASNRTTIHNDLNGAVFCFTAGSYAGAGQINTSISLNVPGLTYTSSLGAGNTCPGPVTSQPSVSDGHLGGDPTNVTWTHSATVNNDLVATMHVENGNVADSAAIFEGADGALTNSFPTTFLTLDNVKYKPTAAPLIYKFGVWNWMNSLIDEASSDGSGMAPFSTTGAPGMILGSTVICGTFTTGHGVWWIYNILGSDSWGCKPFQPTGPAVAAYNTQPLSYVVGYNRFMGELGSFSLDGGVTPVNNFLFVENTMEELNDSGGVFLMQVSADDDNVGANNIVMQDNTLTSQRLNIYYAEGIPLGTGVNITTTGGALTTGTGNNYYVQFTESCVTGAGSSCNSSTETSSDGPNTTAITNGTSGSTGSLAIVLPCDGANYKYTVYLDTATPPAHYGTVGGVDGKLLSACQTITITAIGSAHTPPQPSTSFPNKGYLKGASVLRGNIFWQYNGKTDTYGPASGNNGPNGGRIGNWERRWQVGDIGNISVVQNAIATTTTYAPTSAQGEVGCWLCYATNTVSPATSQSVSLTYQDDRGWGGGGSVPAYPSLNIGEGDYCPSAGSFVGGATLNNTTPAGYGRWPWDIQGSARKSDGTAWAGAYEAGCL